MCLCSHSQVPDYLDVIKKPMDFNTMRRKVEENKYNSLEEFEKDFYLVWHNATVYNQKDTIYYKAAIRIKDAGMCWEGGRGREGGGVQELSDKDIMRLKIINVFFGLHCEVVECAL